MSTTTPLPIVVGRSRSRRRTRPPLPPPLTWNVVDHHCWPLLSSPRPLRQWPVPAVVGRCRRCRCRRRPCLSSPPATATADAGRTSRGGSIVADRIPSHFRRPLSQPPSDVPATAAAAAINFNRRRPPPSCCRLQWLTWASCGHHGRWRRCFGPGQSRPSWPRSSLRIPGPSARMGRRARRRNARAGGCTSSSHISRWGRCQPPSWSVSPL